MEISSRAVITQIHGMLFGVFFLLLVFGLVVELYRSSLAAHPSQLNVKGLSLQRFYLMLTTVVGWVAVLSGAYVVYPW
jgi:inner membrane protein involved in colicin E2 resistance